MPMTNMPEEMKILTLILSKQLKSGMLAEVYLVKTRTQYEAAIFVEQRYKPGPPIPRPTDNQTEEVAYWMGVRPSIGLSLEEGDFILAEVKIQNLLHKCCFRDQWGLKEI